ncbi:hypothetical protein SAMN05421867_10661 [Cellulomonas marina]|uniref:Uncharacterized protein n=1 Tax=Cellulomonas marina TaxID=988821 RepID=A0A1I0XZ49_9CELL|nr:hypothetical protein SAMN05421867_10661 [Cellulomonas marina]
MLGLHRVGQERPLQGLGEMPGRVGELALHLEATDACEGLRVLRGQRVEQLVLGPVEGVGLGP